MLNSDHSTRLLVEKDVVIDALTERINLGEELLLQKISNKDDLAQAKVDWVKWYRYNLHLMLSFFSDISPKRKIEIPCLRGYYYDTFEEDVSDFRLTVNRSIQKLNEFIKNDISQYQECLEVSYNVQESQEKSILVEKYTYEFIKK
ncbi:MAG: hypothetical protein AB1782_01340 [Cyanobacteriota bacterium]